MRSSPAEKEAPCEFVICGETAKAAASARRAKSTRSSVDICAMAGS
jgi:hypothetical protein